MLYDIQSISTYSKLKMIRENIMQIYLKSVIVRMKVTTSQQTIASIFGFTNEKFLNIFWSMLLISVLSVLDILAFSFKNSLSKLLQSFADFWEGEENIVNPFFSLHPLILNKVY